MRRTGFTEQHEAFRRMFRDHLNPEVVPECTDWLAAQPVPREFFLGLGNLGVVGMAPPEQYGGGGQDDFLLNAVLSEEAARAGVSFDSVRMHMDVVVPYFDRCGAPEQRPAGCPGSPPPRTATADVD